MFMYHESSTARQSSEVESSTALVLDPHEMLAYIYTK